MFEGSYVALITPFNEKGEINERGLEKLIKFHINNGTNGIVTCGTTGESATLSHDERKKVVELAIKYTEAKIPVIAGTGSSSTKETIDLTYHAKQKGADAALIIVPYYNKPDQRGIYAHFKTITEEVDIPIIVYNIPSRTGINLLPDTLVELAKIKNIVGVKEASGDLDQIIKIVSVCGEKINILSGDDNLLLPILAIGGKGIISVTANIIPKEFSNMVKLFREGYYKEAKGLFLNKIYPISKAMFIEPNPAPIKASLELMGLPAGSPRLPMYPASTSLKLKLKEILLQHGII